MVNIYVWDGFGDNFSFGGCPEIAKNFGQQSRKEIGWEQNEFVFYTQFLFLIVDQQKTLMFYEAQNS